MLEHLAQDLEDQQVLNAKLLGAALYPAIVSLVALAIVLFLVTYVVPQVASVFAGSKRALPFLTVLMLGLSDVVRSYGVLSSPPVQVYSPEHLDAQLQVGPPHLRRDWAHPCHIRTGTGLAPATSAPGPGSPRPHRRRPGARAKLRCG